MDGVPFSPHDELESAFRRDTEFRANPDKPTAEDTRFGYLGTPEELYASAEVLVPEATDEDLAYLADLPAANLDLELEKMLGQMNLRSAPKVTRHPFERYGKKRRQS